MDIIFPQLRCERPHDARRPAGQYSTYIWCSPLEGVGERHPLVHRQIVGDVGWSVWTASSYALMTRRCTVRIAPNPS